MVKIRLTQNKSAIIDEAAKAYYKKAQELYGEFARLNFDVCHKKENK